MPPVYRHVTALLRRRLTARAPTVNFGLMPRQGGSLEPPLHFASGRHAPRAVRRRAIRLVGVAARLLAGTVIVACSDSPTLAPRGHGPSAATLLPAASRYIIELRQPGPIPTGLAAAITAAGGRVMRSHASVGLFGVQHLSPQAATAIAQRPDVQAVMPDRVLTWIPERERPLVAGRAPVLRTAGSGRRGAVGARADPRTAAFFAHGHQWNMTVIHADSAWQVTSQGAGAHVFILDTGADTAHQDLSGRFDGATSTSFVFTDTTDTAFSPFYVDSAGHGSFVSSIIASNSIGVAAVAPQARLSMVKVLDARGQGSILDVASGLLFATDNGADVVNISLGAYEPETDPIVMAIGDLFQRVVDYANRHGVVVVVAAGNDAVNTNTGIGAVGNVTDSLNLPAALHHVISVGATAPLDQQNFDRIASYSNFGRAGVAVFAPGGDFADQNPADTAVSKFDLVLGACSNIIPGCASQNLYELGAGTSFATPHVVGEIAVIKAQAAFEIQGDPLANCLLASSDEVTGVRIDVLYGFGRINVLHGATACRNGWSFVP